MCRIGIVRLLGAVAVLAGLSTPASLAGNKPQDRKRSEHLYIVSFFKGVLTVVDTATYKTVKTIPLSTNVSSVAVTADGAKAYLAFSNGDSLLVVDLVKGGKQGIKGNIGWNSDGVLLSPRDRTLYLATSGGKPPTSKVLYIDPRKEKVTAEIKLGRYNFPDGIKGFQLAPKAAQAFAVDATARQLVVIDLKGKKIARRVPAPKGHTYAGLAIAPDGRTLYAGSLHGKGLFRLDVKELEPRPLGSVDGATAGPVVSSDGKAVYAVLDDTKVIGLQASDGKQLARWDVGGPVRTLAISRDGSKVYVACFEGKQKNKVLVFNARSGKKLHQIAVDSPIALLLGPPPKGR
jgi:DNA-binding beta-propeller fold protein YncE